MKTQPRPKESLVTDPAAVGDQLHALLYEALETEKGGVLVYKTALKCAINDDLVEEWEKYLSQTQNHVTVLTNVLKKLGLNPDQDTPGRNVVRHSGMSLVKTMEIALKAAETGHLVLSTLHTPDVARTMNRVIALSGGAADDLRERLGDALQGIVAQRLLPRADGQGMVLAAEVLVSTGSVREAIKRPLGNPSLKELMESGQSMYGMQTFEAHVKQLVRDGIVDREVGKSAIGF